VLARESAQLGYPEIQRGFVPAMVMAILKRSVSEKRAMELITTGTPITAFRAEDIGLINQVFPALEFDRIASEFIKKFSTASGSALTLTKGLLYHMDTLSFEAAIETGVHINGIARMTEDCKKGIARFLENT